MTEAISIQHEYNHTHGILLTDLYEPRIPIKIINKLGRNDKITITKDDISKQIKYKMLYKFTKDGWKYNVN